MAWLGNTVWLLALVVMILIFMVMDSMSIGERMTRLRERHNARLAWALDAFTKGVRRYWVVAAVFGLIVAACNWTLLKVLAVPLAGVWFVFSFVTNFVPNIGFVLGLLPPAIMAFLDSGPMTALWVIIGYSVLNVVIQVIIQPRVSGGAVGITATVAVLSLLLWAVILGPIGAILAIPATLLLKTIFIDADPSARWVNALIAANPRTSEEDPIRLSELLERAKRLRRMTTSRRATRARSAANSAPTVPSAAVAASSTEAGPQSAPSTLTGDRSEAEPLAVRPAAGPARPGAAADAPAAQAAT
jgi:hypothetical protein